MDSPIINNRRIAKNTLYLYLRTGLSMLVSLYTSRVVLNSLGVEDYGIWGVIGGLVSMFGFINSSLSSTIFRYLAYSIGTGEKYKINNTFNASIIIHVSLAIIVGILCESIGHWFLTEKLVVPDEKREITNIVYHIVILTSCISLLSIPLNSVIIAYERMNVYAYLSIVDVCIKLGIAYIIYIVSSNKLIWYAGMMLCSTIIMLLFYYFYVHHNFKFLHFQKVSDKTLYRSLLQFSGWSLFGNIAYVGYTQGLNMLLNIFFGPIVNAARSISLQIEQSVRTFVTNFQTAINPQIIKSYAQNNVENMQLLMFRSSKFSVFLLLFFAVPLVLETDVILSIWLNQVPEHCANFCRIMFIIIILETMTNSIGTGIVATGNIKWYQIIIGSILILIVPVSYIILKTFRIPETTFIVYLTFEIIAVITRLLIAHFQIHISISHFASEVILRCICVGLISLTLSYTFHAFLSPGLGRLLVVISVSIISNSVAMYLIGLTHEERNLIVKLIQKKLSLCSRD